MVRAPLNIVDTYGTDTPRRAQRRHEAVAAFAAWVASAMTALSVVCIAGGISQGIELATTLGFIGMICGVRLAIESAKRR